MNQQNIREISEKVSKLKESLELTTKLLLASLEDLNEVLKVIPDDLIEKSAKEWVENKVYEAETKLTHKQRIENYKNVGVNVIYCDGGSYNNGSSNQNARMCIVRELESENEIIFNDFIGNKTSNEAEFLAISKALDWIIENDGPYYEGRYVILSDSKIAVNMVNMDWNGKKPHLIKLRDEIAQKRSDAGLGVRLTVEWIPRQKNIAGNVLEFGEESLNAKM